MSGVVSVWSIRFTRWWVESSKTLRCWCKARLSNTERKMAKRTRFARGMKTTISKKKKRLRYSGFLLLVLIRSSLTRTPQICLDSIILMSFVSLTHNQHGPSCAHRISRKAVTMAATGPYNFQKFYMFLTFACRQVLIFVLLFKKHKFFHEYKKKLNFFTNWLTLNVF